MIGQLFNLCQFLRIHNIYVIRNLCQFTMVPIVWYHFVIIKTSRAGESRVTDPRSEQSPHPPPTGHPYLPYLWLSCSMYTLFASQDFIKNEL